MSTGTRGTLGLTPEAHGAAPNNSFTLCSRGPCQPGVWNRASCARHPHLQGNKCPTETQRELGVFPRKVSKLWKQTPQPCLHSALTALGECPAAPETLMKESSLPSWGSQSPQPPVGGGARRQFPGWAEPEFHDSEHGHGLANQLQNLGVRNQCPDLAGPTDTSCGQRTGNPRSQGKPIVAPLAAQLGDWAVRASGDRRPGQQH